MDKAPRFPFLVFYCHYTKSNTYMVLIRRYTLEIQLSKRIKRIHPSPKEKG